MPTLAERHSHPRDGFVLVGGAEDRYTFSSQKDKKIMRVTDFKKLAETGFPSFMKGQIAKKHLRLAKEWRTKKFDSPEEMDARFEDHFEGYHEVYDRTLDHADDEKATGEILKKISAKWNAKSQASTSMGTRMHKCIEKYWDGEEPDWTGLEDERRMFMNFVSSRQIYPFRSEFLMGEEEYLIAGTADFFAFAEADDDGTPLVTVHPDGSFTPHKDKEGKWVLDLYDWKRAENIRSTKYAKRFRAPLEYVVQTTISEYGFQLNSYKWMGEARYGFRIRGMYLVAIHPSQKDFDVIEVPRMTHEIDLMLSLRRKMLALETAPTYEEIDELRAEVVREDGRIPKEKKAPVKKRGKKGQEGVPPTKRAKRGEKEEEIQGSETI